MSIGYQSNFIGVEIPLPAFGVTLQKDVLVKTKDDAFYEAFDDTTGAWREYIHYSVATNKARRQPICVALNVNQSLLKKVDRGGWKIDKAIGAEFQLDNSYYKNNNLDRGHMARRATAAWGETKADAKKASDDTMYYSNACLQHMNLNQDEWLAVEDWVKDLQEDKNDKISVFSGPIYGSPEVPTKFTGSPRAEIPAAFFKVVSFLGKDGNLSTRAFIYLQDAETLADRVGKNKNDYTMFQVSTAKVEEATGLIFSEQLHSSNPIEGIIQPLLEMVPTIVDAAPPTVDQPSTDRTTVTDTSGVFIAAALINPAGRDERAREWVSIANYSVDDIDLSGWTLDDQAGSRGALTLSGILPSGGTLRVAGKTEIILTNSGGSLTLKSASGNIVDSAEWTDRPTEGEVTMFTPN